MAVRRRVRVIDERWAERSACAPGHMAGLIVRGHRHLVPVHDLSAIGAMIRMPAKMTIGEMVTLVLGRGVRRDGAICWLDGTRAGIVFLPR